MKKIHQLVLWTLFFGLFAVTHVAAQDQLADMVGIWDYESSTPQQTFHVLYQVTTGPASLTLRYVSNKVDPQLPGGNLSPDAIKLYQLTAADRNLSGTVTIDNGAFGPNFGCRFEQRTFPVQGRISPDWSSISIVENHEWPYPNCGWVGPSESVRVFKRYR